MSLPRLVLACFFAACGASDAGSNLRGSSATPSVTAPPAEHGVSGQGQVIGCSCSTTGECRCSRSEATDSQSAQDEEALEQTVLKRTEELNAWWQTQDEKTRLTQWWSGPLANQTTELWHASAHAVHVSGGAAHVSGGAAHVSGGAAHVSGGGAHVHGGGAGCVRRGTCGCIGTVGCGCAGHAGCAVWR